MLIGLLCVMGVASAATLRGPARPPTKALAQMIGAPPGFGGINALTNPALQSSFSPVPSTGSGSGGNMNQLMMMLLMAMMAKDTPASPTPAAPMNPNEKHIDIYIQPDGTARVGSPQSSTPAFATPATTGGIDPMMMMMMSMMGRGGGGGMNPMMMMMMMNMMKNKGASTPAVMPVNTPTNSKTIDVFIQPDGTARVGNPSSSPSLAGSSSGQPQVIEIELAKKRKRAAARRRALALRRFRARSRAILKRRSNNN